jgi:site-specific DNA recombinase
LIEHYLEHKSLNAGCRYFPERFGYQEFWQTALRRWLTSPTLQGDLVYYPKSKNPIIHPNSHESLISREEAREIKDILAFNKKMGGFGHRRAIYPLSGLVKCECGGGCIVAHGSSKRINYYICAKYRMGTCHRKHGTRMDKLESAVINALVERAANIANFANQGTTEPEESAELRELRSQLARLEAITVIPNRTVNPAILEAMRTLRDEIQRLEQIEICS